MALPSIITNALGTDSEQDPPKTVYTSSVKEEDEKEEEKLQERFDLSYENDEERFDDEMDIETPLAEEPEEEVVEDDDDDNNKEYKRLESTSSVQIEPSYPEEELIYEGDVENEGAPMDIQVHMEPTTTDDHHDELEVICAVTDFDSETTDKKATSGQVKPPEKPAKSESKPSSTSKPLKKITFLGKEGQKSGNGDSNSSRFVCSVFLSSLIINTTALLVP